MLSITIETLKCLLLEYRFYFVSILFLLALLIYNHNETLALEKELIRINKELHVKQVTFERIQKAYNERAEQRQVKLERMLQEINSYK